METHRNSIILDFDHTLFNTTRYIEAVKKALAQVGISTKEFDKKRIYLKQCCSLVDIDTFITHLSVTDKTLLHDTIHHVIVSVAASCIFDDVQPFINRHYKKFDIILLTQGNQELQKEKIVHSALAHIAATIITTGKKNETIAPLCRHYQQIHFIDDKAKHIAEVKNALPDVTTYFIVREEDHPYGHEVPACGAADYTITDLSLTIGV